jgi:hypothetical protein
MQIVTYLVYVSNVVRHDRVSLPLNNSTLAPDYDNSCEQPVFNEGFQIVSLSVDLSQLGNPLWPNSDAR